MKKMERLIGIIYALKENKKLTAKEISDLFEVSERTIYRDIDALSQLQVPIRAFEGFKGGYEIDESYFVPSIAFKRNEILYLLICLKIGQMLRVPNMKEDYHSLRYKLLNILDEDAKRKYLKLLERIQFDINRMVLDNYRVDIMEKIIESFWTYKNLVISYCAPRKDTYIEREITPYTLSFYGGGWYLSGYCYLRGADRVFRLDRIKDIALSESTYLTSTIEKYLETKDKKAEAIRVRLEMDKPLYETVKNDLIFTNAEVKIDEKVQIILYTDAKDSIINLAIRNYNEVSIVEPDELISRVKEISKNVLEKYKQL